MVSSTSAGMVVPFADSIRASTAWESSVAFVALRFATEIVTAGWTPAALFASAARAGPLPWKT